MRLDPQLARRAVRYGVLGSVALGLGGGVLVSAPAFSLSALALAIIGALCLALALLALDEAQRP